MAEKVFTWLPRKTHSEGTEPLTGGQIRAARALVRWEQGRLAERAGVAHETIDAFEAMDGPIGVENAEALAGIERAFSDAGVRFIRGVNPGLRLIPANDLETQIRDARRRVEADVETSESMAAEDASPRKGMAALRRGLSENKLRALQAKKRE